MKNYIKHTVILLLSAALLCSCSGKSGGDGVITLEWWQFWTDPSIKPTIEKMVTDYEALHPNLKINLTDLTWANGHEKIVIAFSSGEGPDIIELGSDWIAEFSSTGHLHDITNQVSTDSAEYLNWSPGIYENQIYAVPWILGTRLPFYNKDLIKQSGLDENFVPINWGQLKEACYKIDSLGDDIYGFGSNAAEKHRLYKKFLPFFWSHDGRIISKDGKYVVISSDKAYRALRFYKELSDSCSMIDTQRRLEDAFLAGKIGFILSGDWLLKRIKNENIDINFGTTLMPGPEYPGNSFAGGEYLAVGNSSSHKTEALEFIRYITSAENQIIFCKANQTPTPSSKTASKDDFFTSDINIKTFVMQMNMSTSPPTTPQWVYIEDIIEKMLEDVLFNDAPIAQSLYDAKFKIEKLIFEK